MNIDGKEYTEGQLQMLLWAVKHVLTDKRNITRNNAALRDAAVQVGLVTEDECK